MLGNIEYDAINVLKFGFRINSRVFWQLHKELASCFFDFPFCSHFILDYKAEMVEACPITAVYHPPLSIGKT